MQLLILSTRNYYIYRIESNTYFSLISLINVFIVNGCNSYETYSFLNVERLREMGKAGFELNFWSCRVGQFFTRDESQAFAPARRRNNCKEVN